MHRKGSWGLCRPNHYISEEYGRKLASIWRKTKWISLLASNSTGYVRYGSAHDWSGLLQTYSTRTSNQPEKSKLAKYDRQGWACHWPHNNLWSDRADDQNSVNLLSSNWWHKTSNLARKSHKLRQRDCWRWRHYLPVVAHYLWPHSCKPKPSNCICSAIRG